MSQRDLLNERLTLLSFEIFPRREFSRPEHRAEYASLSNILILILYVANGAFNIWFLRDLENYRFPAISLNRSGDKLKLELLF